MGIVLLALLTGREQIREVEGFEKFKYGFIVDQTPPFDEDSNVIEIK